MSMASFVPTLLLAQLVLQARKNLVAARFCNTSITVALKEKGDKMDINTLGDVTTNDTDETVPMTYGDPSTSAATLEITMDKTVSIKLKDKELQQIEASGQTVEDALAARMIYKLNDDIDQLVAALHSEATNFYETGTTSWQWGTDASDVPKFFASLHKTMNDALCEQEGRFVTLPNVAIQGLQLFLSGKATPLGDQQIRTGVVSEDLFGFTVMRMPNCVNDGTILHGLAGNMPNVGEGVPGCMALAVQISPFIEKLRLEGYWATGVRARATAGCKVFKTDRCFDINLNPSLLA